MLLSYVNVIRHFHLFLAVVKSNHIVNSTPTPSPARTSGSHLES